MLGGIGENFVQIGKSRLGPDDLHLPMLGEKPRRPVCQSRSGLPPSPRTAAIDARQLFRRRIVGARVDLGLDLAGERRQFLGAASGHVSARRTMSFRALFMRLR